MRTTITVEGQTIEDVMKLTHQATPVAAIGQALERRRRLEAQRRALALRGDLAIEDSLRRVRKLATPALMAVEDPFGHRSAELA